MASLWMLSPLTTWRENPHPAAGWIDPTALPMKWVFNLFLFNVFDAGL
jgi:hypothetical protein